MMIHHTSFWMMLFLTYSEIIISSDSDSWLETMTSKMDSLYINQVWTMVEAPMSMTQQVTNRDSNLNFCYCHTPSRELVSSGRANAFMNSDRYWGDGTSIFDEIVKIFDFIKYRWTMCVCKKIVGVPLTSWLCMCVTYNILGWWARYCTRINGLLITNIFIE